MILPVSYTHLLKYGLIGQETTGVGGMFNAFRVIPVMIEIAKDVEKYCPDAWIINYSNPTGLVTEALNKVCNVKVAGLCAGGMRPRWWAAEALNIPEEKIYYDYLGLNHMNFSYNMTIDGRPITDEEFSKVIKKCTTCLLYTSSLIREKKFRQAKLLFKENSFGINEVINMGFLFILYVYKRIRFGTHF